jgi:hypothetical protein
MLAQLSGINAPFVSRAFASNSRFFNILPLTDFAAIFYSELPGYEPRQPNAINILPALAKKNMRDPRHPDGAPLRLFAV